MSTNIGKSLFDAYFSNGEKTLESLYCAKSHTADYDTEIGYQVKIPFW